MPGTTAETTTATPESDALVFRHEALLYNGDDGFLDAAVPFLQESLDNEEPVLVIVSRHKVELLRSALGGDSSLAWFADMAEVGMNPARMIPAWRSFVEEHAPEPRRVRGIGEPIWGALNPAELMECQRHESLLNTAFGGSHNFWLLCPYDTATLPHPVLERARRDHPFLLTDGVHERSPGWRPGSTPEVHQSDRLSEPARELAELTFKSGLLGVVREVVATHATRFGMCPHRADDLIVAVNEVATNSVVHGGGSGVFRLWREAKSLVCEISDDGRIEDPLAGRVPPQVDSVAGRGLWLANQLCDLVQIRLLGGGSVVRLHMTIDVN